MAQASHSVQITVSQRVSSILKAQQKRTGKTASRKRYKSVQKHQDDSVAVLSKANRSTRDVPPLLHKACTLAKNTKAKL